MKKLYFIRHGQSVMNTQGVWSGHTDTPLTEKGHEQAKTAGIQAKKQGLAFDIIISSPLQRAHTTAKYVATHTNYPHEAIVLHDNCKERNFGSLDGRRSLKIFSEYALGEHHIDKYPDVEPLAALQKRADALYNHVQSLDHETVLIVAHGAFGRALYRSVNNLPMEHRMIRFKNAEIIRFV